MFDWLWKLLRWLNEPMDPTFGKPPVPAKPDHGERSSRWPTVRKAWLKAHRECAACGSTENLEVHHKLPFHLSPELELDESNFITLCEGSTNCHFLVGHCKDWQAYNPRVVLDAAALRHMIAMRCYSHPEDY